MAENRIEKITIVFPPGDQLTSLLIQKEANSKIEELINRLCTLRAIEFDLKKLSVLNDIGGEVNLNQTVSESGLCYIEIVDKKSSKKEKKQKEKEPLHKPPPPGAKPVLGKLCYLSLDEQLLEEEKTALVEIKKSHSDLCENFTDEYIASCLIARKLDIERTVELLKNGLQFRKESGFETLPKFSEIPREFFDLWDIYPGARDKIGRNIRYGKAGGQAKPNVGFNTIPNVRKYFAWMFFVGMFADGFDGIRAGSHTIFDFSELSWNTFDIDYSRTVSKIVTSNFPDLSRKFEVVNPPSIINALFTILKSFIPKKNADRMSVVKDHKKLLKHIDPENLIDTYGGKIPHVPGKWHAYLQEWAEKKEQHLAKPIKH